MSDKVEVNDLTVAELKVVLKKQDDMNGIDRSYTNLRKADLIDLITEEPSAPEPVDNTDKAAKYDELLDALLTFVTMQDNVRFTVDQQRADEQWNIVRQLMKG